MAKEALEIIQCSYEDLSKANKEDDMRAMRALFGDDDGAEALCGEE